MKKPTKPIRSENIGVRLTPDQLKKLKNNAEKKGLDASTYARVLILEGLEK